jgi:hypothetical protein
MRLAHLYVLNAARAFLSVAGDGSPTNSIQVNRAEVPSLWRCVSKK